MRIRSPKKIIGSIGRRYGGRPFQVVRKFVYDTILIPSQVAEIIGLYLKKPRHNSDNQIFYDKYYGNGKTENLVSGIICMYDGRLAHGGITDRLKGILNTYNMAKKYKIPFYINWISPFRLEKYLVPADVDWRIDEACVSSSKEEAFPVIIDERLYYQAHLNNTMRLRGALHRPLPQTQVYSNANNLKGKYKDLYDELFMPSDDLTNALKEHLEVLGSHYYAYSFRFIGLLGGFTDYPGIILEEDEAKALIVRVIHEFKKLIKEVPDSYRIFVTSDSKVFLDCMMNVDSRIYIVPGDVKHTDYDANVNDDVWLKIFVDQHILMKADKVTLMQTGKMYCSDFPRFAAEIGATKFVYHKF